MRTARLPRFGQVALLAVICLLVPPAYAQTPPPTYASYFDRLPCVDRIGRCFDASIGGQPVEVIAEQAEYDQLNNALRSAGTGVRDVYWTVRKPVSGREALDVAVRANALGAPHVGEPRGEPDVALVALDRQKLASTREQVTNPSVRVNGQAVVTDQRTLAQDALPPGRYVFTIRYPGSKNWDRKSVLLTVR